VSRSIRILLVAVVAFAAVGGYWKLALAPKRAEAAELDQKVAVAEAQLVQTQGLIATYEGAQKQYKTNYATLVRLGKAVPTDDDTRSLLVQLDTSAKRSGIDFDTINLNSSGTGSPTATGTAAVTTPGAISTGAFSAMPFQFNFTGTFGTLGNFFTRLESFVTLDGDKIDVRGRLLRIESLKLEPAADGWPGLQATVGASSYIVPEATEVAATTGTTPSTTTAATPSTGTTPGTTGASAAG
jgi:Tfp pilus assembly protein PilO